MAGWLWYAGTLVPVSGLVQIGGQAFADRYTYFPSIGVALAVVWTAADLVPIRKPAVAAFAIIAIALAALTWRQTAYWTDDLTLWPHALDVSGPNAMLYSAYGAALEEKTGRTDEAMVYYEAAVKTPPGYGRARYNLARLLAKSGRNAEAVAHYRQAIVEDPLFVASYMELGALLIQAGSFGEAEGVFRQALRLDPESAVVLTKLAWLAGKRGDIDGAIQLYRQAARSHPADPQIHGELGVLLGRAGDLKESLHHLQQTAELLPDSAVAQLQCGIALDKLGRTEEAIVYFRWAIERHGDDVRARLRLATALARQGNTAGAAEQYRAATRLDPEWRAGLLRQAWIRSAGPKPGDLDADAAVWAAESVCFAAPSATAAELDALGAAYARAGRFAEAMSAAERALSVARGNNPDLARAISQRLALYRQKRPFLETSPPSAAVVPQ
jgi:tetratricopeptide (TPR) repeat protein